MLRASRTSMLVVSALLCGACDPYHRIAASRTIRTTPDTACILQVLGSADEVRHSGVREDGVVWAEIVVPEDVESPSHARSVASVGFRRDEKDELEMELSVGWIGQRPDTLYEVYVRSVLRTLRDRVIERCGA